jgi:hypothetical protein
MPSFGLTPSGPGSRFSFKFDPNTPTKELLPAPPRATADVGPVLKDDLAMVPEVQFQAPLAKVGPSANPTQEIALQLARITHVNAKKTDAFMVALLENRPDLAGLPFVMGDDCRTNSERTKQFTSAVNLVRSLLSQSGGNATAFWTQFTNSTLAPIHARPDRAMEEQASLGRVAALMQMLAPESVEYRMGLVKYLAGVPHVESTKALARLAIFSAEDDVRLAAIDSLKVRREKDYTDVLVKGLRYPWPAVARRSADVIARLGRSDLIPELIAVLEEDDPRMPQSKTLSDGKKVMVVREMVKVNHNGNCMMCHSPGNPNTTSGNALMVEVPVPGQPLNSSGRGGYGQSFTDLMVRVDVTYLRQDFSVMMTVADAHPWPELQRFDFLVRERQLTDAQVELYRAKLTPREEGVLSPYHRAMLASLREMTGKDTTPTAEAWRKLLGMPSKTTTR